jgi:Holliday junction resolvase-like predicted endonuclease
MGKGNNQIFTRLTEGHELVGKLLSESWWTKLVSLSHADPDINIQLRTDYINVYSKMGNLLKIGLQANQICCEIHYKYLISDVAQPYVKILPDNGRLKVNCNVCPNVEDILEPKNFRIIKQNIATYAGEEKTIQSKLVEKNKDTVVDVEVAFSENGRSEEGENARIDLVNFDKNHHKLVFVELKQAFDARLYNGEINKQIERYANFARKNEEQIIKAYQDALATKKKLGIITESSFLADVTIEKLEPKPILAIAAYNQDVIDGLRNRIEENLDTTDLSGLYFFGKDVDLNLGNKSKNKVLFA